MTVVIDASVAVKWLAPEPDSLLAESLLDEALAAPDLLFAEVANILWKKQARGEMDATTVRTAARWLRQVPLAAYPCSELFDEALQLAIQLGHPAYDCFYLALAVGTNDSLITADKRLFERCQRPDAEGLRTRVRLLLSSTTGAR